MTDDFSMKNKPPDNGSVSGVGVGCGGRVEAVPGWSSVGLVLVGTRLVQCGVGAGRYQGCLQCGVGAGGVVGMEARLGQYQAGPLVLVDRGPGHLPFTVGGHTLP